MKKYILILMLLVFTQFTAQENPPNRFSTEEHQEVMAGDYDGTESGDDDGDSNTPNPADPAPIDDYIPLLVIAAAGIIVYKGYKKTHNA